MIIARCRRSRAAIPGTGSASGAGPSASTRATASEGWESLGSMRVVGNDAGGDPRDVPAWDRCGWWGRRPAPEARAALERQPLLRRPGQRVGAPRRSSDSRSCTGPGSESAREPSAEKSLRPEWCTTERADQRARPGDVLTGHPATVGRDLAAHVGRRRAQRERLDVADGLAQAAVLVEVAAHEVERAVIVGVQDRRARVVDLRPAGGEQLAPEGLVLGVGHLAEADLLPARARVTGVDVGEEGRVALALDDGVPSGAKLAKNSSSSRAIIGLVPGRGRCGP